VLQYTPTFTYATFITVPPLNHTQRITPHLHKTEPQPPNKTQNFQYTQSSIIIILHNHSNHSTLLSRKTPSCASLLHHFQIELQAITQKLDQLSIPIPLIDQNWKIILTNVDPCCKATKPHSH
jgi:hypothetical protein